MNIDIFGKISEYFVDIWDTINLSNINKTTYRNKHYFTLNNTFFLNNKKCIHYFTKYKYNYVDINSVRIDHKRIYDKLKILIINDKKELDEIPNIPIEEIVINFNEQIYFRKYDLKNVKRIKFTRKYKQSIVNLPDHIIRLEIPFDYNNYITIPRNLNQLIANNYMAIGESKNLEYVKMNINDWTYYGFNGGKYQNFKYMEINIFTPKINITFPEKIIKITFKCDFDYPLNLNICRGLKCLYLSTCFNNKLILPDSLEYLYSYSSYKSQIYNIPKNIKKIYVDCKNIEYIFNNDQLNLVKDCLYDINTSKKIFVKTIDEFIIYTSLDPNN